jgi:hypothetical protein
VNKLVVVAASAGALATGIAVALGLGRSPESPGVTSGARPLAAVSPPVEADGRNEAGARETALRYAAASQDWLYMTDQDVRAEVEAIATPAAAARLASEEVDEVAFAREALALSPGRVWWFVRPLASDVVTYSDVHARVRVWVVTVLSAADVAVPQADWFTIELELRWLDGWRLEDVRDEPGPTPVSGTRDEPWQPEPFDDALDGFERVGWEGS